jgi:2-polyprenyl-6-methoxyphenol hydroxylase-like FAD-dependent oxidoreductase
MNRKWDAVVVGAGPAGATLAARLGRRGWRVVLVDTARFPRQKVCGEYLSAAVWDLLSELDVEAAVRRHAVPLDTLRLVLPGGQTIDAPFDGPESRRPASLSRFQFDDLLLQHAGACGVEICEGYRVRNIKIDAGRAVGLHAVSTGHKRALLELDADLIVAADGRRSIVVRQTGVAVTRRRGLVGFKQHFRRESFHGPAAPASAGMLEMHSLPGGYVGIGPIENDAWNVCGVMPRRLVRQARGSIDAAWKQWTGDHGPLADFLRQAKRLGPWLTIPEVATLTAVPGISGVLYVGDACGTIEPLAGQGMTMALVGAALAEDYLSTGREDACQAYFAAWQRQFGNHVRRANWLAGLLRRPRLLAALLPLDWLAHRLASTILTRGYRAISVDTARRQAANKREVGGPNARAR